MKAKSVFFFSILLALPIFSYSYDLDDFAKKIATNIGERVNEKEYKTIALWEIKNSSDVIYDSDELRDMLNINLIKLHRYDIIDRSRLNQLLQEIKFSGTELVDPTTMKKLGEMYGIDLFLYGTFYNNTIAGKPNSTLILKAIDVEKAQIAWAIEVPLENEYLTTSLDDAVDKAIESFNNEKDYLTSKKIKRISFWDIGDVRKDEEKQIIDKLSVKLVESNWQVVDRENLNKLLEEIKFSSSGLVAKDKAKEFGKIYGIDGFIFGSGKLDLANKSDLRLQLIDTETGVLQWGEKVTGEAKEVVKKEEEKHVESQKTAEEKNLNLQKINEIKYELSKRPLSFFVYYSYCFRNATRDFEDDQGNPIMTPELETPDNNIGIAFNYNNIYIIPRFGITFSYVFLEVDYTVKTIYLLYPKIGIQTPFMVNENIYPYAFIDYIYLISLSRCSTILNPLELGLGIDLKMPLMINLETSYTFSHILIEHYTSYNISSGLRLSAGIGF